MIPRDEITQFDQHAAKATDLLIGLFGGGSSILAFFVSHLETIETWLRITSLIVGICVGLATLHNLCRRNRGK